RLIEFGLEGRDIPNILHKHDGLPGSLHDVYGKIQRHASKSTVLTQYNFISQKSFPELGKLPNFWPNNLMLLSRCNHIYNDDQGEHGEKAMDRTLSGVRSRGDRHNRAGG